MNLVDHFLVSMPGMDDPAFKDTVIYVCEHNDAGAMGVVINRASDITVSDLFERIELDLPTEPTEASDPAEAADPSDLNERYDLNEPSDESSQTLAASSAPSHSDGTEPKTSVKRNQHSKPIVSLALTPVLDGGPVQSDRGFVLHEPQTAYLATIAVGGKSGDRALTTSRDVLEAVSNGTGPQNMLVTLGYSGWSAGQLETEISQNAWLTIPAGKGAGDILWNTPLAQRKDAAIRLLGIDPVVLTGFAGHA